MAAKDKYGWGLSDEERKIRGKALKYMRENNGRMPSDLDNNRIRISLGDELWYITVKRPSRR